MDKIRSDKNLTIWMLVTIAVSIVLWFIAGQEYTKYKIRETFSEWLTNLSKSTLNIPSLEGNKEDKIDYSKLKAEDKVIVKGANGNDFEIKVFSWWWYWKKLDKWYAVYNATNTYFWVILEAKNLWNIPDYYPTTDIKLYVDGKLYDVSVDEQLPWKYEGYEWCIGCQVNPDIKARHLFLFDIPKKEYHDIKLILDNKHALKIF